MGVENIGKPSKFGEDEASIEYCIINLVGAFSSLGP